MCVKYLLLTQKLHGRQETQWYYSTNPLDCLVFLYRILSRGHPVSTYIDGKYMSFQISPVGLLMKIHVKILLRFLRHKYECSCRFWDHHFSTIYSLMADFKPAAGLIIMLQKRLLEK